MRHNARSYPTSCRSAYCGKCGDECNAECRHYSTLQEFKAWVTEHNAKPADPIWSPCYYIAQS